MKKWVAGALILNSWVLVTLFAQTPEEKEEEKSFAELSYEAYGLDQTLVNGFQYVNRYGGALGHPYFQEDKFYTGEVLIGERLFKERQLKYDLVSQQIELLYRRNTGVTNRLIMIPDHIMSFTIGEYSFRRLDLEGNGNRFYQVVPTPRFTCYLHWSKSLIPVNGDIRYSKECTDQVVTYLIEREGMLVPFNSRRSLTALFPEERQKEIRRMLRLQQFQPRRARPETITRIMDSISDILERGGRE